MATGAEMAMNAMLKLFGVESAEAKASLAQSIKTVLTIDQRISTIERSLLRIETHLGIVTEEPDHGTIRRLQHNGNGSGRHVVIIDGERGQ